MADAVCPDGEYTPVMGNVNVWMDNSHVTACFSASAGTIFERRLLRALAGAP